MKLPDYEKRSKFVQELIDSSSAIQEFTRKMNEVLYSDLINSVEVLKKLRDSGKNEMIQLRSAKNLLELAGFGKNR